MSRLVVPKNALSVVDPACFVAHLLSGWRWNWLLGILGLIWLNVKRLLAFFFTLGNFVAIHRH